MSVSPAASASASPAASPSDSVPQSMTLNRLDFGLLALVLVLGAVLRVAVVVSTDLPLGNGGYVYQSVRDLQANGYVPPTDSSYNLMNIPNIYPPLGFYILGLLSDITGASLIDVMRWYPVAMNVLGIALVYTLSRMWFESGRLAMLTTAVFAVMPSTIMTNMGGSGSIRVTGMCFALIAIYASYRIMRHGKLIFAPVLTLMLAMAMLSQPQWGIFAYFSIAMLFFVRDHALRSSLKMTLSFALAMVLSLLLSGVWIVYMVAKLSWRPLVVNLLNQADSTSVLQILFTASHEITGEPLLALLAALTVVGVLVCLSRGEGLLALWLLVTLVMPLPQPTLAIVPMAMVMAVALDYLLLTGISSFRVPGRYNATTRQVVQPGNNWAEIVAYSSVVILLAYTWSAVLWAHWMEVTHFQAISETDRAAMSWIAENVPEGSDFLVLSGIDNWYQDSLSEWFPALAQHSSLATVRATEWFDDVEYPERVDRHGRLQACLGANILCLEEVYPTAFSTAYVYLGANAEGRLRPALLASERYERIYPPGDSQQRTQGVLIFRRNG